VPLALDLAIRTGAIKPGHKVMLQGWAAASLGASAGGDIAEMKFAMVFPGQGSQSVGMLAGYGDMPRSAETARRRIGCPEADLAKLYRRRPREELNRTVNTHLSW